MLIAAGAGEDKPAEGRQDRLILAAHQGLLVGVIRGKQDVPVLPGAAAKCTFFSGRDRVEGGMALGSGGLRPSLLRRVVICLLGSKGGLVKAHSSFGGGGESWLVL